MVLFLWHVPLPTDVPSGPRQQHQVAAVVVVEVLHFKTMLLGLVVWIGDSAGGQLGGINLWLALAILYIKRRVFILILSILG